MSKLIINGEYFSKKDFGKRWTEVINQGNPVSGDDLDFITESILLTEKGWADVIRRAPDKIKIEVGKQNYVYPVKGIILVSGFKKSRIWIGKQKITNILFPTKQRRSQESIDIANVKTAFRQLAEPQMKTERNRLRSVSFAEENPLCPLSGQSLRDCKTHVDHTIPFTTLVEEFCRENRLDISNIKYSQRGTKVKLKDPVLAQKFVLYHLEKAELSLVCAEANLQKGSKIL